MPFGVLISEVFVKEVLANERIKKYLKVCPTLYLTIFTSQEIDFFRTFQNVRTKAGTVPDTHDLHIEKQEYIKITYCLGHVSLSGKVKLSISRLNRFKYVLEKVCLQKDSSIRGALGLL